ncbi:MAG: response regulator [Pedobacter sp.]|uniref:response regulator transcription factor n=1 Tax=Pedobacter sp. TaxID=1411316 RepID=UPI003561EF25
MEETTTIPKGSDEGNIWILEDDPDIGYILQLILNEEGFETTLFNSAVTFRIAIARELPDLLLMDVMLPDGNGEELCAEIKNDRRSEHLPVLMMSAHARLEQITKHCAADGFISKPFDLTRLLAIVHQQLS